MFPSSDIPDMGSHIMIDFVGVKNFDLSAPEKMESILEEGLKRTDCNLCEKSIVQHAQGRGYSMLFLLSESHLSVHTWPAKNSFTIDFYNVSQPHITINSSIPASTRSRSPPPPRVAGVILFVLPNIFKTIYSYFDRINLPFFSPTKKSSSAANSLGRTSKKWNNTSASFSDGKTPPPRSCCRGKRRIKSYFQIRTPAHFSVL